MLMKDNASTRIKQTEVTSYATDYVVVHSSKGSTSNPTIRLTIGSTLLILNYNAVSVRDDDIKRLDTLLSLD